ncbi:DUF4234 domain-containing protein [Candidatus Parcubacteria bacterium]|nr:MAG: DUF4234 domain-containing protein [Candidatus Parcubacteria bacterium]
MTIKYRNPWVVLVLSIATFGIYALYWTVKTKGEINRMGGKIPTAWLVIVPIANLYFLYRYMEGFSAYVKKDNNPILWVVFYLVIAPMAMLFVQMELNKYAARSEVRAEASRI